MDIKTNVAKVIYHYSDTETVKRVECPTFHIECVILKNGVVTSDKCKINGMNLNGEVELVQSAVIGYDMNTNSIKLTHITYDEAGFQTSKIPIIANLSDLVVEIDPEYSRTSRVALDNFRQEIDDKTSFIIKSCPFADALIFRTSSGLADYRKWIDDVFKPFIVERAMNKTLEVKKN